ncbi:MAG: sce7726 family protein [Clostridium sp.]|nr:sce7726 family protein [Clostridium sp.]
MNLNNRNNIYFNFAQKLFANYNVLQIKNELSNNFIKLSQEYNVNLSIDKDIRTIYNELINKYYHNEITIKANFINNVLLKSKNHVTIFEFNLENSRVDLCKINGKSIAYEIKTDLDNFSRLTKQINDYSEVFEEIYVICSKINMNNIINVIPNYCGIYTYTISKNGKYNFKKERKAFCSNNINSFNQLKLLSNKELNIKFKKYNSEDSKNSLIFKIVNNYSKSYINSVFKNILKDRYVNQWTFLKENHSIIYEIDYQWFFKNNISPNIIYQ